MGYRRRRRNARVASPRTFVKGKKLYKKGRHLMLKSKRLSPRVKRRLHRKISRS